MSASAGRPVKHAAFAVLLLAASLASPVRATQKLTLILTNAQGTPVAQMDASGNVTYEADYRPYGQQQVGAPQAGPGYTGHVNDPDTGLVYMQARYYDSAVGRFISVDPSTPSQGNLFNFNRYNYVENNPENKIDPNGRFPENPLENYLNRVKNAAIREVHDRVCRAAKGFARDIKNSLIRTYNNNTVSAQVGVSGTAAANIFPMPKSGGIVVPSLGIAANANISIDNHLQVKLNLSIAPMAGAGGGAIAGAEGGFSVSSKGPSPTGITISNNNHAEVDVSAAGLPANFGVSADYGNGDASVSAGSVKVSAGEAVYAGHSIPGVGQWNMTITFNRGMRLDEDHQE